MSTYLYVDSNNRDIHNFPDACNFVIGPELIHDWPDEPRCVNLLADSKKRIYDYFSVISIKNAWVIYNNVNIQPLIKLNFYNKLFNDGNLINTTDNNKEVKFILSYDKTINGNQVYYNCKTHQVMRFKRTGTFVFESYDMDNNPLVIDRLILFIEVKPYHLKYPYDTQAESLQKRDLIT